MKRLIFMTILLCFVTATVPAAVPAIPAPPGALAHIPGQLRDTPNGTPTPSRGVIMHTIMHDSNFAAELNTIQSFVGTGKPIPSYQEILVLLQQSCSAAPSIAVIEAFEKAIMHAYDYDSYMIGSYKPCMSMFITGIKWPSMMLNPWYWFGRDELLESCLKEMDHLAKAAWRHSTATSNRIKLVVHSYRHWRRNLLLTIGLIALASQSGTIVAAGNALIAKPVKAKKYLLGCLPLKEAEAAHGQTISQGNTHLATDPKAVAPVKKNVQPTTQKATTIFDREYLRKTLYPKLLFLENVKSAQTQTDENLTQTAPKAVTSVTTKAQPTPQKAIALFDIQYRTKGLNPDLLNVRIENSCTNQLQTDSLKSAETQPDQSLTQKATTQVDQSLTQQPITKHECPACPCLKFIQYNFLVDTLYKKSKPHCEFIDDCINIDTAR